MFHNQAFWEHSLHALAIVSEEGRIVEANPAFCQLIGIETHQATGINIRNLVADGEFREDMRMIDTMFLGQMVENICFNIFYCYIFFSFFETFFIKFII